ncbi:hypothetical protein BRADI_4g03018v3 [Brachypodium distachyon]|uniref:Uncharacterized protein n=1 Tax=Brachypodium distachyon TaxID=15368 RepID=A0A2K2CK79_BRADI|nr:hypothetical protein BRADI_4g03018v3 [Brachypodium distachyon]
MTPIFLLGRKSGRRQDCRSPQSAGSPAQQQQAARGRAERRTPAQISPES